MARSKANRKLIIVVGGFSAAAALLLGAVLVVNQVWIKNAERNVRAGDALMEEGKPRQAMEMYGRALSKKPDQVAYVEKMEDALSKVVATTPTQAAEDYRTMVQLKRARTRAQPTDPAQWRELLDAVEAESDLYARGEGWLQFESVAKDMREVMAPGTEGARMAEESILWSRAQRDDMLSSSERADLERQLEAFLKANPKSWRGWTALAALRIADEARLRGAGQASSADRRRVQVDEAIAGLDAAADAADPRSAEAVASIRLDRALLPGRSGQRMDMTKVDAAAVESAADALAKAAMASGRPHLVRAATLRIGSAGRMDQARAFVAEWLAANPDDMLTQGLSLDVLAAGRDPETSYPEMRAAAEGILARPQLPTSLSASVQAEIRSRAIQVLMDALVLQAAKATEDARRDELLKELDGLRGKLVEAQQNSETTPMVIAADAKIRQVRNDMPGAAAKWQEYFAKVPQPPADAFVWATLVSRAQGDLGLAMQYATRGAEAHPSEVRLAIQRAELALQLGRMEEAAGLYDSLAKALPDQQQFVQMAAELQARVQGGAPASSAELANIEAAMADGDMVRARELASAWMTTTNGALQATFAQVMVEERAGDKAKALELVRAALERFPNNPDLAKTEAFFATEDPIERVDMMSARLIKDPQRLAIERLRAYRALRTEMARQLDDKTRSGSDDTARIKEAVERIDTRIAEAEKAAAGMSGDDATAVELLFNDAIGRRDFAAAETQVAAAAAMAAQSPALETMLRARLLDAQGKSSEAIALLEKARQSGRSEAPIAALLAFLQERAGNEPAALALWKEAYDRRPNDQTNVRGYVRSLGRSGQGRAALDLIRNAVAANPSDADTAAMAAEFEVVYGLRSKAVELRQRVLQLEPSNRGNMAELYSLLFLPPDFGSIRDASGRPRFDARTWATVPADEQQRLLTDARVANLRLAEELYQAIMKETPLDAAFASRKAAQLRQLGRFDEATATVQTVVDRAESEGKANYSHYVALAGALEEAGNREGSDRALARARELQDPQRREVDAIIVEMAAARGDFAAAIEAMKNSFGEQPSPKTLIRLADLQLLGRQFADASATVERARAALGTSPDAETQRTLELLAAGIYAGEADDLREAGKDEEARARITQALAAIGRAEAAQPADLIAPLRRAQLLRAMAVGMQDPKKFDEAIVEADRVLARNSLYWPAVQVRADLSLDKRDVRQAIALLERYIQSQPGNDEATTKLMDLLVATGNVPGAVTVVRSAVALRPQDPVWADRLGDLLESTGDRAGAAQEFERAFNLDPRTVRYLEKASYARVRAGNAAEALAVLRGSPELVANSPVLRGIAASALMKSNRRDEAMIAAREAIVAARGAKDADATVERTAITLREMFEPKDMGAQLEALLVGAGTPTPVECAILADTYTRMGPAGADKALEWCGRVDALGESAPVGVRAGTELTRGSVLYGQGKMNEACDAFERAAKLSPRNPAALNNAAYLMVVAKGDAAGAYEYAAKAVLLAPSQPDYLDTMGLVLLKLGRLDEAADALEKSIAAAPSSNAYLHLAQVRAAQGRAGDARQALERARAQPASDDTKKEIEEFAATLANK